MSAASLCPACPLIYASFICRVRRYSLLMSSSTESSSESSSSDTSSSEARSSSGSVENSISFLPEPLSPATGSGYVKLVESSADESIDYGKVVTVEEDAVVSGVPFFQPAEASSESDSDLAETKDHEQIEIIQDAIYEEVAPVKSKKEMRKSGKRPKASVRSIFSLHLLFRAALVLLRHLKDSIDLHSDSLRPINLISESQSHISTISGLAFRLFSFLCFYLFFIRRILTLYFHSFGISRKIQLCELLTRRPRRIRSPLITLQPLFVKRSSHVMLTLTSSQVARLILSKYYWREEIQWRCMQLAISWFANYWNS